MYLKLVTFQLPVLHLCPTWSADGLTPNGTRPAAGTMLITTLHIFGELPVFLLWKYVITREQLAVFLYWQVFSCYSGNFNFNFQSFYLTPIYMSVTTRRMLQNYVWRLLLRYMHTACIRATKKGMMESRYWTPLPMIRGIKHFVWSNEQLTVFFFLL